MCAALVLFLFSALSAKAAYKGKLGTANIAGDPSLLETLGPVSLLAAIALASGTLLRWAWMSLMAARRAVPNSTGDRVAHSAVSIVRMVLLSLLTLAVVYWAIKRSSLTLWWHTVEH